MRWPTNQNNETETRKIKLKEETISIVCVYLSISMIIRFILIFVKIKGRDFERKRPFPNQSNKYNSKKRTTSTHKSKCASEGRLLFYIIVHLLRSMENIELNPGTYPNQIPSVIAIYHHQPPFSKAWPSGWHDTAA